MKILKVISFIVFVLILINGFAYINIMTSEKYEIDLQQTDNKIAGKPEMNERMEVRKVELANQKKWTIIQLQVLSIVLLILLIIVFYNSLKTKQLN
ncbi:MAG TPA: hypothetical protein VGK10_00455 [Prolixibacteraceae bacterium]|jgi:hypothetical protein